MLPRLYTAVFATLMILFLCGSLLKTHVDTTHHAPSAAHSTRFSDDTEVDGLQAADLFGQTLNSGLTAPQSRPLHKRLFGSKQSAEYEKALKTGQSILCTLDGDTPTRKAEFDNVSDLQALGWSSTQLEAEAIRKTLENFAPMLQAKGISVDSPTMRGFKCVHVRDTVHSGVKYPATGGTYVIILDPEQGLLVPAKSYSPAWYVKSKQGPAANWPAKAPLSKLNNWSDVAFLVWLDNTTPQNRQNLHYVAVINALNQATVNVVSEALKADGVKSGTPPAWPGRTFVKVKPDLLSKKNKPYAAVLGTPNVLGSGWLVAQHQSQMGRKRVGGITVFDSSGFKNVGGGFQLTVLLEVVKMT